MQIKIKAISLIAGWLGVEILAFNVIPVVSSNILGLFIVLSALVFFSVTAILSNHKKSNLWKRLLIVSGFWSSFMLPLTYLMLYSANNTIAELVSEQGISSKEVSKTTVLHTVDLYSKANPAHRFLLQYYLLPKKDGDSLFVWNLVRKRAVYISQLYHNGYLAKNASIPNFGFLHIDSDIAYAITGYDNKLHQNDIKEFYRMRRHGYGVRYANDIVEELASDVNDEAMTYSDATEKSQYLKSITSMPTTIHFRRLHNEAQQLGLSENDTTLNNLVLGSRMSTTHLLRNILAQEP